MTQSSSDFAFKEEELKSLKDYLGVQEFASEMHIHWGSKTDGSRHELEQALQTSLKKFNSALFSISHSLDLGGFVIAKDPRLVGVGLDIESCGRITPEVVQRVCKTPEEFQACPDHRLLWACKEAAYKALKGPNQPQVMSQIEIHGWQNASHFKTCTATVTKSKSLKGLVLIRGEFVISIFVAF